MPDTNGEISFRVNTAILMYRTMFDRWDMPTAEVLARILDYQVIREV